MSGEHGHGPKRRKDRPVYEREPVPEVPGTGARWWAEGERCEVWTQTAGTFGADGWEQAVVRRALPSGVGQAVYVTLLGVDRGVDVEHPTPFLTGHPGHAQMIRTPSAPGGYRSGDAVEVQVPGDGPWLFGRVASIGTIEDGPEHGGMRVDFGQWYPHAGFGDAVLIDMTDESARARVRRAVTAIGGVEVTGTNPVAALLVALGDWARAEGPRGHRGPRDLADMSVGEARAVLRSVARAVSP